MFCTPATIPEPVGQAHPQGRARHRSAPGGYGDSAAYDRYMGRWSALLARRFLHFVGLETAKSVLDVGSGTGALTAEIAASSGASWIVGLDPVAAFVEDARQRFADPRVGFERGEAADLPFPDGAFDATLAQLSLHHVADGRRALGEMRRVTRSGGLVAACEWDAGPGMEMLALLRESLALTAPQLHAQAPRRAHAGRGELLALWRAGGIEDAEEAALVVPLRFSGFDDFWVPFIEGPSVLLKSVQGLLPPQQEDFRRRVRDGLLGDETDGPFTLRARAWAVRGRVS